LHFRPNDGVKFIQHFVPVGTVVTFSQDARGLISNLSKVAVVCKVCIIWHCDVPSWVAYTVSALYVTASRNRCVYMFVFAMSSYGHDCGNG